MRTWSCVVLALVLAGCPYVSKEEYDAAWDEDGDGWGIDDDCAPDEAAIYPGAPDVRGDGCDSDCGAEPDQDGDDWPDSSDCAPEDPLAYPCSSNEAMGDGADMDCDGKDGVRLEPCPGTDPDFPDAQALNSACKWPAENP